MNRARVVELPIYVHAEDVMRSLGCARSTAYWHLRRAAGRGPGAKGLLRVRADVWVQYADRLAAGELPAAPAVAAARSETTSKNLRTAASSPPRLRLVASNGEGRPQIPLTQPRTKQKGPGA